MVSVKPLSDKNELDINTEINDSDRFKDTAYHFFEKNLELYRIYYNNKDRFKTSSTKLDENINSKSNDVEKMQSFDNNRQLVKSSSLNQQQLASKNCTVL
jgi:hypothetical protein